MSKSCSAKMKKLIQIAIECGRVRDEDQFYSLDSKCREIVIMAAGRAMTRRIGQGWSR